MLKKQIIPSILGGVYISIGALAYLILDRSVAGAVFFSTGILLCIYFNGALFTRAFPLGVYSRGKEYAAWQIVVVYIGNFVGAVLFSFLIFQTFLNGRILETVQTVVTAKLADSMASTLISGCFAGLLVGFAVMFKRRDMNVFFVVLTIAIFVVLCFDHCIANMFYFGVYAFNGGEISGAVLIDFLFATLGNMIGGGMAALIEPKE